MKSHAVLSTARWWVGVCSLFVLVPTAHAAPKPDTKRPTVTITSPTSNSTWATASSPISIGGSASDNVGVTLVTWSNNQGGSGTANGTTNWSSGSVPSIVLQPGTNILTVSARDAAGNIGTDTLTVTYDPTPPDVSITTPTGSATFDATTSPLNIGGSASDNVAVTVVSWANDRGGAGTATGTTSWSVSGIVLQNGTNVLTVTARDAAGNTRTDTLTVTYTVDSTAPTAPTSLTASAASSSQINLSWPASTDDIGVTGYLLERCQGAGCSTFTQIASPTGTAYSNTGLSAATTYVYRVRARDAAGNLSDYSPSASATTLSQTPPPSSGLVAAWALDEGAGSTTADASGNGHTGTLVGGPVWAAGQFGSALSLNGTSAYVATDLATNLPAWTISTWVRSPTAPSGSAPTGPIHREANYQITWHHPDPTFRGAAVVSTSGGWYAASFGALTANTWYYLAATYDGQTLNAYTNGVLVTSNPAPSGAASSDPNPLMLGRHATALNYFNGSIDNVRIYDRALTLSEIQADMNAAVGATGTLPTVTITTPTSNATWTTSTSPLNIGGTASDDTAVTGVSWTNDRGGSGTANGTTSWSVSGIDLQTGTNVITVTASDSDGNVGTDTLTVTYTVGDTTPPTVPTGLTASAVSASQINLTWSASTDAVGVTGYIVERCQGTGCTTFAQVGFPVTTSYSDSGLTAATTYVYRVRARDAAGNISDPSGTASATTSSQTPPPSTGLVAAWALDEGGGGVTADASGHGHTGTLLGGPVWVAGQFGAGLSFNGTSAYVATDLNNHLPNWTISTWVRSPLAPSSGAATGPIHREANYQITWDHPSSTFRGAGIVRVGGNWYAASFGALAANTWYYLAATYDGQTLNAYKNGVLVTSNTAPSGLADSDPNQLTLGRHSASANYFNGSIDNVRIYDRALTSSEIQADMNAAVLPTSGNDTTPPTVTVTSPENGSTVSGTVTVTATASDAGGVAGVQFYLDGSPLGSEDTVPPYSVNWNTGAASNTTHVLTARARDFAGNATTSSSVTVTVSNNGSGDPAIVGQWSAPFTAPVRAVHVVLLRTGHVLMWDAFQEGHEAYLWNISTGQFTYKPSPRNVFCAAQTLLSDGRVIVVGGHDVAFDGIPEISIFDPSTLAWSAAPSMTYPRWYPTSTTLGDGRVLVVSGAIDCPTCIADVPEIYDPSTNTWTQLTAARLSMPLYPFMFQLPDGRVLYAGSNEANTVTQALNLGTNSWSTIDPVIVPGGSAVMYRPGKVLKAGHPARPNWPPIEPSITNAYVLDMTQASPHWREVGPMTFPRSYHVLTMLPDGNVLVTSGSQGSEPDTTPVRAAEIFDVQTETWIQMGNGQNARTYHASALLLPDARVLVAGSGGCCGAPDQFNAEIFSPPYLFRGPRPVISSAPGVLQYGSPFTINTPNAATIASVALVRSGAMTHSFDHNQRYVPLTFSASSGSLSIQAPANGNIAPPGEYLLFIVDTNGVPSVAPFVRLQP